MIIVYTSTCPHLQVVPVQPAHVCMFECQYACERARFAVVKVMQRSERSCYGMRHNVSHTVTHNVLGHSITQNDAMYVLLLMCVSLLTSMHQGKFAQEEI